MPRRIDIEGAFHTAIKHESNGRRTVTTVDFVNHLARINWNWSFKEANDWIESQARTFMLYNPNGGL
ncbi:DNA polymerase V [Atlantibacter sp. RC6]|uniref:DNA polymerase V n=1 Tax=Atlantibacter sp. RC6 TaxID=2587036 RepID=UPI0016058B8D|nr:DNA polymerase V [Atlantibacter sp. RC6]MBB3323517.1 inhibitor of KinA sporulation pathway (predicted exonuclease) [Atlantibacter sp. RC6]